MSRAIETTAAARLTPAEMRECGDCGQLQSMPGMARGSVNEADRARVERILLAAAKAHSIDPDTIASDQRNHLQKKFGVEPLDLEPRVFFRITDNWLELTVRFIVRTHLIRAAKDAMSREIVEALDIAGIGIASATYDIVGFPPIEGRAPAMARVLSRTRRGKMMAEYSPLARLACSGASSAIARLEDR